MDLKKKNKDFKEGWIFKNMFFSRTTPQLDFLKIFFEGQPINADIKKLRTTNQPGFSKDIFS